MLTSVWCWEHVGIVTGQIKPSLPLLCTGSGFDLWVTERDWQGTHLKTSNWNTWKDDRNYGRKSMIKMYSLQNRFISWTNKVTAPGLLTSAAGRTWGPWLAVHDVADVSLACTKFSSSKSPQSSHSPPRSAPTLGLCEDEAFLPWLLQFGAASELFKQTVLLVLIWLRSDWWLWFALAQNPGFIHTVEPEHRNIAFRMATYFDWRMKKLIKVDVKQSEYTIYTSCVYILRFFYCAFCTWKPKGINKWFPRDLRIPRLFACEAASDWTGLSITSCMSSIP